MIFRCGTIFTILTIWNLTVSSSSFAIGQTRGLCGGCLPIDYRLSYSASSPGLPFTPGALLTPGLGMCAPITGGDLDAFSYLENACCFDLPETTLVLYSVDRFTHGLLATTIRDQDVCNGAAGDIFGVVVTGGPPTVSILASCFLVCDAPNLGFIDEPPVANESDLDALDVGHPCLPPGPLDAYMFSTAGPGSLVMVDSTGTFPVPGPGTGPGDDIDALNVEDVTCQAVSFRPGSPILPANGFHPGDVLCGAGGPFPPLLFLDHFLPLCMCDLGTPGCPTDNLDGLWFVDPGQRIGLCVIHRCVPVTIVPGMQQIHVLENHPILWVNNRDPQNPVPVCPVIVHINGNHIFIRPGESGGLSGLPALAASGPTTYPFTVENASNPADFAVGIVVVTSDATGADMTYPGMEGATPSKLRVVSIFPNPVSTNTEIVYDIPRGGDAILDVVDVQGRRVRTLISMHREMGRYGITWDGRDNSGNPVMNGMYFIRLECGGETSSRTLTLLR
jgi:hypothetical protein